MFQTLSNAVPRDKAYPARTHTLDVRRRVLAGTIYDVLSYEFHDEKSGGGEYIPLRQRRPSVRYNLCRLVVQDTVALLFGSGRFPVVESPSKEVTETLAELVRKTKLPQAMLDAALRGSVGSVVVHLRVLSGRIYWDVLDTDYLTPEYDPNAPDTLLRMTERYKVRGDVLQAQGYKIERDRLQSWFWFQRVWDSEAETWFEPWPVAMESDEAVVPKPDKKRTTVHGLGFVPMVWIKNLPGGTGIDGACTFWPAIDTSIEIDYQLSQGGRGLKYSSDPLLLIKEPAAPDESFVRSGNNALVVSADGDAKLLEISGGAVSSVIEYARFLRELAIESIHGNRAAADRISAAQSGRAIELMYQPLIFVADQMRGTYGEGGILTLMRMVAEASQKYELVLGGKPLGRIDPEGLDLRWPDWFAPKPHDKQATVNALSVLREAGLMSRETGVRLADALLDIPDGVPAELARIEGEERQARLEAAELPGAQFKVTENAPT